MLGTGAGRLYAADGRPLEPDAAVTQLSQADVVLFGELHGNPAVHALELELARELVRRRGDDLLLGAEMFEADDQLVVDEYLAGLVLHRHLLSEAKVWDNYESDYRPLVELAKEAGRPFIATNVPRRYASLVAREGLAALERLGDEARRYLAPLPIAVDLDVPGYREMLDMDLPMMPGAKASPLNLVAAQAVKDATMAHFIALHCAGGRLFLHFNGVYHSQRRGGICWYLSRANPRLRVASLSSAEGDATTFEDAFRGLGDVVFVAPAA
jgi:uncharacterized iron-regulated protein